MRFWSNFDHQIYVFYIIERIKKKTFWKVVKWQVSVISLSFHVVAIQTFLKKKIQNIDKTYAHFKPKTHFSKYFPDSDFKRFNIIFDILVNICFFTLKS